LRNNDEKEVVSLTDTTREEHLTRRHRNRVGPDMGGGRTTHGIRSTRATALETQGRGEGRQFAGTGKKGGWSLSTDAEYYRKQQQHRIRRALARYAIRCALCCLSCHWPAERGQRLHELHRDGLLSFRHPHTAQPGLGPRRDSPTLTLSGTLRAYNTVCICVLGWFPMALFIFYLSECRHVPMVRVIRNGLALTRVCPSIVVSLISWRLRWAGKQFQSRLGDSLGQGSVHVEHTVAITRAGFHAHLKRTRAKREEEAKKGRFET